MDSFVKSEDIIRKADIDKRIKVKVLFGKKPYN
jgi:hypothetical protein